jgi:hypothetical protein
LRKKKKERILKEGEKLQMAQDVDLGSNKAVSFKMIFKKCH